MLTKNIKFKNFLVKSKNLKIKKIFKNLKKNFFLGNEKLLLLNLLEIIAKTLHKGDPS